MCYIEKLLSSLPKQFSFQLLLNLSNIFRMKPKLLGGGSAEVKRNLFFIYSQMQQMCRMLSQSLAGLMADNEIHQE